MRISFFLFLALAPVGKLWAGNERTKRQERASVDILVGQSTNNGLKQLINQYKDKCSIDWSEVDRKIASWFDSQKAQDTSFYQLNKNAWNAIVDETKEKARSALAVFVTKWNDAVDTAAKGADASKDAFFSMTPYGKIKGTYAYWEGERDPGDPGWTLDDKVKFHNVTKVSGAGSIGIAPVEVTVSGGVSSTKAEVVFTVESGQSISGEAGLPDDLNPDPADPANKPTATTGYYASMDCTVAIQFEVSSVVKVSGQASQESTWDLGHPTRTIEAGKDKPVGDE